MASGGEREPGPKQVYCLGRSLYGGENLSGHFSIRGDEVVDVAAGDTHSAVITAQGRLFMFGTNEWGQLGLGHKNKVTKPTCVSAFNDEKVRLVACGRYHTLVATDAGKVYTAGSNCEGQLGVKTPGDSSATFLHVASLPSGPIRGLSCGADHSVMLTEDGAVYAWGAGSAGQLGTGTKSLPAPKQIKIKSKRKVTRVACGYYHTVFVTELDEVFICGEGDYGKLGLNDEKESSVSTPTKVPGMDGHVLSVACGSNHTVVVTDLGVYAWGDGSRGQLGLTVSIHSAASPTRLGFSQKGAGAAVAVACGENHSCLVTDDHQLWVFGQAQHDRLGFHSEEDVFEPTLVDELVADWRFLAVACGGCHTLAIVTEKPLSEEDVEVSSLSASEEEEIRASSTPTYGTTLTAPPHDRLHADASPTPSSTSAGDNGRLPAEMRPQSARTRRRQQVRSLSPLLAAAVNGNGAATAARRLPPIRSTNLPSSTTTTAVTSASKAAVAPSGSDGRGAPHRATRGPRAGAGAAMGEEGDDEAEQDGADDVSMSVSDSDDERSRHRAAAAPSTSPHHTPDPLSSTSTSSVSSTAGSEAARKGSKEKSAGAKRHWFSRGPADDAGVAKEGAQAAGGGSAGAVKQVSKPQPTGQVKSSACVVL